MFKRKERMESKSSFEEAKDACKFGNPHKLRSLLEADPDLVLAIDEFRRTLLFHAASYPNLLRMLIEAGAEVNVVDKSGSSPLDKAITAWISESVEVLLAAGANTDNAPKNKIPRILRSMYLRGPDMVESLIDAGANTNVVDTVDTGITPLRLALERGHLPIIHKFLICGTVAIPSDRALNIKNEQAREMLHRWPSVPLLRAICIRIIRNKHNKVAIPPWLPLVLLEWPTEGESLLREPITINQK